MTDPDGLDPRLAWRLRSALDQVQPPHSPPRYQEAPAGARRWGAAQGILAAGIAGLMILTLLAAASSRSIDLQHRIVNTFQSATEPSPSPEASQSPTPVQVQQPAPPSQQASSRPEPSETPEPSQRPEPSDSSPEPSGERSGSPSPSPTPSDR